MRIFVTGVGGQLGHDVMNELAKRGYEGVGSDIAPSYSGIADGTAVTTMPYVQMDITDKASDRGMLRMADSAEEENCIEKNKKNRQNTCHLGVLPDFFI